MFLDSFSEIYSLLFYCRCGILFIVGDDMKKKDAKLIGVMTFVVCLSLLNIVLSMNLKTSYAIDTGIDRSGFPTSNFKSSLSTNNVLNYISEAATSGNKTSAYTSSFAVPSGLKANNVPLYSLMKNAEAPKTTETFELGDDNPTDITDKGILYILSHGYNTTNTNNNVFTSKKYGAVTSNDIKQYVTQIALWVYIYEHKSSFSNSYCKNDEQCNFYGSDNNVISVANVKSFISECGSVSGYNYLNYITELVTKANSYTGEKSSTIASLSATVLTYQIDSTKLVTDYVTPEVTSNGDNFMYFTAEVSDPNNYGAYLADNNGNRLTDTSIISSFKVIVPLKEDLSEMDLSSIEVNVYGHFIKEEGKAYRVTKTTSQSDNNLDNLLRKNRAGTDKLQRFADVLLGYTPNEVVKQSFGLYNFTKISKIDVTSSNELPGAYLEIKKNDVIVANWVSETTPHYLYLGNGDYELCETTAPEGYEKQTECINFTVDGTKITTVVMENARVPDTAAFSNYWLYIVGALLLAGGSAAFVLISKKRKSSV